MAQLPYRIALNGHRIGALLDSYPSLCVPLHGIGSMNLLEVARIWIYPSIQRHHIAGSDGSAHAASIASCSLVNSLRIYQRDWRTKHLHLPSVAAAVSWADETRYEGVIYRAENFRAIGTSGGSLYGNSRRN